MTNIFLIFQADRIEETDCKKPHCCRSKNRSLVVCIGSGYGKTDLFSKHTENPKGKPKIP